jgi:hypothetical protein
MADFTQAVYGLLDASMKMLNGWVECSALVGIIECVGCY